MWRRFFDEKKNKLYEKKAWAKNPIALCRQAQFVTIAHNLLVLFERRLQADEGIDDTKARRKRQARLLVSDIRIRSQGLIPNPMVQKCTRITQRSLQFIRWLRYCLATATSYSDGVALLRPLMQEYLA